MSTHHPFPMSGQHNEEVLQELGRVRDESVGTRHVAIKTENMVKSLTVELKQISQRQTTLERRSLLNSAVAYVIFVLLIFTGLYLNFNAKEAAFQSKLEERNSAIANLQNNVDQLKRDLGKWKQIERELLEFEQLVREDNKEEAVNRFTQLRTLSFAGLLEELITKFKGEVANEKYEQGKVSYNQRSYDPADKLFQTSLSYDESPPYLGELLYYQGMCALRLEDFDRATDLLTKAQTFKHDRKIKADIDFHLARAADMRGDKAIARRLYYRFYVRYSHSMKRQSARAKRRYEQLDKKR